MDKAVRTLLGFARRAGKVVAGTEGSINAVKHGRAKLIFLAEDGSDRIKKEVLAIAEYHQVPVVVMATRMELGEAIGLSPRLTVAVTDKKFTEAIIEALKKRV